jgi:predicted Zn-dependent protease
VIRVDLAEALQKDGQPDEAEREWRDLARTEDDPAIQYRLAAFLAERKKSPEALEAIRKCLSLLGQHADADLLQRATELKTKLEGKDG